MISHHSWRLPPCPPPLTAATASMPHLCLLRVHDQPPLFRAATMPTTINTATASMSHLCLLRVNDQPPLFKAATMPTTINTATASMPHLCLLRVNDQPPLIKVATMPTTINNSNSTKASPLLAENPWLATTLQGRGTQKVNDAWWPPWPWGPSCTPAECSATGLSGSLTAAESTTPVRQLQPPQSGNQATIQSIKWCVYTAQIHHKVLSVAKSKILLLLRSMIQL